MLQINSAEFSKYHSTFEFIIIINNQIQNFPSPWYLLLHTIWVLLPFHICCLISGREARHCAISPLKLFNIWKEARHCAISPLKFDMFLIFPNFQRSLSLQLFLTRAATFVIVDIKVCFTCGESNCIKTLLSSKII